MRILKRFPAIIFCLAGIFATANAAGMMHFNIIMKMTQQGGSGCGIWWSWQDKQANKPKLVIDYSEGGSKKTATYQHGMNGMKNAWAYFFRHGEATHYPDHLHDMLVKKSPARNCIFLCDISDIPSDAAISKAELFLHIHTAEGLGNSCKSEVVEIHHCPTVWNPEVVTAKVYDTGKNWNTENGDFGEHILTLKSAEMHASGWNKGHPNGSIDFTDYMKGLQAGRSGSTEVLRTQGRTKDTATAFGRHDAMLGETPAPGFYTVTGRRLTATSRQKSHAALIRQNCITGIRELVYFNK
jgi:hypothetical protein